VLSNLRELQDWLRPFELDLSGTQLDQTQRYLDALLLWNRKMNLVSQHRPEDIITKHLADSFVAATALSPGERIADIGSGGGFPGIPVAIARPQSSLYLVEANQKKASFLSNAVAGSGLTHVTVASERIEAFSQRMDIAHSLTAVTARALSSIEELQRAAADLLASGGRLIAMKGPNYATELDGSSESHLTKGGPQRSSGLIRQFALEKVTPYQLPDGSSRCLVVFRFT
jgi:16S rRNA (guanine527-N7)-methyltransferase